MSTSVLSVRVSDEERALLAAASNQSRTNINDFVRRKALEAAEMVLLEHRFVTIPAKDWQAFRAWANSPPRRIRALEELWSKKVPWSK